jgi:N-acetylmuramoyl-L-alanine amidase
MKIAFVIGHDKTKPGAYSTHLGQSEYIYNSEVASYLSTIGDIYKRPSGGGYMTQMRKLADELNPKNYDLVIELHFNAFNKKANGCEAVIHKGNHYTGQLGEDFCTAVCRKYGTVNRGVKEHYKGDRGYGFLSLIKADTMILEPFFGDHEESLKFKNEAEYAKLLKDWLCN